MQSHSPNPKPNPKSKPKTNPSDPPKTSTATEYQAIADQWAKAEKARRAHDAKEARQTQGRLPPTTDGENGLLEKSRDSRNAQRKKAFERRWWWTVAFWGWMLAIHAVGLWLFTGGFLLTRLVLEDKSSCDAPPTGSPLARGSVDEGCWHPKSFERAVVLIIDALRYDFTVPEAPETAHIFHNAFPFLYETALRSPRNAFLRPFIADPPTTTLQRLKGLTTGTLPTFMDAGSNFAGTAIDEDNLLLQLRDAGKKIAHLGDDTWWALFPDYFEANISRAYDSFNVWDLHTVDNGVMEHIFPLLGPDHKGDWDLLVGHCLGVDHAGHRYGPDHPAMTAKLQQMDGFVRQLADAVDDDTVLIVMGDHGMDGKGDHGGESDDEVEAALWMYSKRPVFGRTSPDFATPPPTAKTRPVNQIDLVPTLALMLGIPIPYNNLGIPIEEVFVGPRGDDWSNLAAASLMASAGIERYQISYFKAQSISPSTAAGTPAALWMLATAPGKTALETYRGLQRFQEETLHICKGLWARFDVPRMIAGVFAMAVAVVVLMMYSSRDDEDDLAVMNDPELDFAEKQLEAMGRQNGEAAEEEQHPDQFLHKNILRALWDVRVLSVQAVLVAAAAYSQQGADRIAALVVIPMLAAVAISLHGAGKTVLNLVPSSSWGWMSVVFTLSQSVGFASNSYTIWEDSILLFFITTFGLVSAVSSFRLEPAGGRVMGVYHSLAFVLLGRLASYSKLCREEQMPYCTSTYYASSSSSTSAPWQLVIPFLVFLALPPIIKSFLTPTQSYNGLAPTWIGYAFRAGLFLSAAYWVIDAADNGGWLAGSLPENALKSVGVYLAQTVLALFLVAGSTAFAWAPPSVAIVPYAAGGSASGGPPRIAIMGYGNALGARYLFLPLNLLAACLLLSKPMGTGALALMIWQVLSLAEIIDLNSLRSETIGPIMLALLGNFYFFKTGHQAVLSSIQWDSAFIPLFSIRYPWSPLVVILNTFGAQLVAAACVPLVVMWKAGPKQKGVLEAVGRALGVFVTYYAVEALATMCWAGHLRRHLMLYRVFSPRFMVAGVSLLVLDLLGLAVALLGLRSNALSIGDVFGWAD